jgi:hypothetical protein
VALPEAAGSSVTPEEASDGTPLIVSLPQNAVAGDTVTSIVTDPKGGTLTLSHVLSAADIAAGAITQTIPASALKTDGSLDGPWSTSTTVTDAVGNSSPVINDSFILDTVAPRSRHPGRGRSSVSVRQAENGTLLVVTLPEQAIAGLIVSTMVALPDGEYPDP